MANTPIPFVSFTDALTVAPTEISVQPFDNTKELIFLNLDSAETIWIKTYNNEIDPVISATNSLILGPGGSVTIAIGPVGERMAYGTEGDHKMVLVARAASGTPDLCITYVQCRGYVAPGS